jgi:D-alanine-D-alanine ligase-like ATP-grasp enzyme
MIILIVNPLYASPFFQEAFLAHNLQIVALFTYPAELVRETVRPDCFTWQLFITPSILLEIQMDYTHIVRHVAYMLTQHRIDTENIIAVINAHDTSQGLTDQLGYYFTPTSYQNPATSYLKMDKYAMHHALALHGLNHIQQKIFRVGIDSLEQSAWQDLVFPCFVKPLQGGGSAGAEKIYTWAQFLQFFTMTVPNTQKHLQAMGYQTKDMQYLICQFIAGDLCIVDGAVWNGRIVFSGMYQYHKPIGKTGMENQINAGASFITDTYQLACLEKYATQVLQALDTTHGNFHLEIFWTPDQQPVLVETNPRPSGGSFFLNKLLMTVGLPNQIQILASLIQGKPVASLQQKLITRKPRFILLFHYSLAPLPDLYHRLSMYQTLTNIIVHKPSGYKHDVIPTNLNYMVAGMIADHVDQALVDREVADIIAQDIQGWT